MITKNKLSRYQIDQGFQQPHHNLQFMTEVQPNKLISGFSLPLYKDTKKDRTTSFKQQTKLKFISIQRDIQSNSKYRMFSPEKQQKIHKSMTLTKQQLPIVNKKNKRSEQAKETFSEIIKKVIIPQKRLQIGENLQLKDFTSTQTKIIKQQYLSKGANLVFEECRQANSHGYLKKLAQLKNSQNFLKSKYNKALNSKLRQSSIFPKSDISKLTNNFKNIEFQSRFQCGNLDFVTQVTNIQYDIYLRADSNTLGHQNWFNFKVINHLDSNQTVFLNVCNLKRNFKMIRKGQKIHFRQIDFKNPEQIQWKVLEQDLTIKPIQLQGKQKLFYRLSFGISLKPKTQYQISLLPSYTYSKMLNQIQQCQSNENVQVGILTYSLMGLAIPLVTFTNKNSEIPNKDKKVLLISSRIHPGQTCGSYMAEGVIKELTKNEEQIKQFLSHNVVMLIPMINPDGVVLGNFRTNYLGNDLNRSFDQQNQSTFPEIMALKQLGKKIKKQYENNFLCFLDLHGHSSQKNIFSYGPDFQTTHQKYFTSRFFPKLLQNFSDYFKYSKCTFKLQQYKNNTARGYFLSKLNTMAYTIQSSYALYDSRKQELDNNKNIRLLTSDWIQFGSSLIKAVKCWSKSNKLSIKSTMQLRKQLNQSIEGQKQQNSRPDEDAIVINRLKKQIKKQMIMNIESKKRQLKKKKNQSSSSQSDPDSQNSDAQSQSQDLPRKQKQKLYRRFADSNSPYLFPRILRPAIVHPQVQSPPPPLISISKVQVQKNKNNIINTRIKRNRYNNIKAVNVNSVYTEYLMRQIKGLDMLKPNVQNMKLQKKQSPYH